MAPTDFDQFGITAPADPRLPGGGGYAISGLYDLKPAKFGETNSLVTQASRYGTQSQVYNGADITFTARFGQGGQAQGGLSSGRTVTDNCYTTGNPQLTFAGSSATVTSPRLTDYCHVAPPWSSQTQFRGSVVYPLPWDLQTSVIYQNNPGIAIGATYVASNAEISPALGRNLGACRGAATCNANVTIDLVPPKSLYEPRFQQVDVRLSRTFNFLGRGRVRGNFDVYNLFNANAVLNENIRYTRTNNQWQNVIQIIGGRLMRVGAQIDF